MRAILVLIILIAAAPLFAQEQKSPYADETGRKIKALSQEQIEGYLQGQGMGYAMAAELNHFPGPKHVIELADKLQLSQKQLRQTQTVFDAMHKDAAALGEQIVDKEARLDGLFAAAEIDDAALRQLTREIAALEGDLRAVHLSAHLRMKHILSTHQVRQYDSLRGYDKSGHSPSQHRH